MPKNGTSTYTSRAAVYDSSSICSILDPKLCESLHITCSHRAQLPNKPKNELALERTGRTISLSSFDNNPNASFSYKTNPTMKLSIITPLVFATLSSSISSISGKKISPGVITSQQVSHFSYSCYYSCYDWRMERKSRLPRSASMEQKLCFRLVTYPCLQSRPVASSVPSSYHQHDLPDSKSKRTDLCLSCVSAV